MIRDPGRSLVVTYAHGKRYGCAGDGRKRIADGFDGQ